MRIAAIVLMLTCTIVAGLVHASPPTKQELEAAENGPAGPPVPLELGDYGAGKETAEVYGEGDRDVMPTDETYDDNTGMPDVTPGDAEGNL